VFIDAQRERFGVEPICNVLQFAPSTYWSAKRRPGCARAIGDDQLCREIARAHAENFAAASSKTTAASHPQSSKTATTVRPSQPNTARPTRPSLHETRGGSGHERQ
jgi:hypothetical protein